MDGRGVTVPVHRPVTRPLHVYVEISSGCWMCAHLATATPIWRGVTHDRTLCARSGRRSLTGKLPAERREEIEIAKCVRTDRTTRFFVDDA